MPRQSDVQYLVGKPVGVSMRDGTGNSGILCDVQGNTLYVQEYMYQDVFALKQYDLSMVSAVHPFPPCPVPQPTPRPRPRPRPYPWVY